MDPAILALLSQFGPLGIAVAVGLYVFVPALRKYLKPEPKPLDPNVPLPIPDAPPRFPILNAILKSMFGDKAPDAIDANPELIAKLRSECDDLSQQHFRSALEPEGNRGWLYTERLAYDDGPQVVEPRSFEAVVTPPPIVDREAVFVGLLRQAAARKFPTLPISEALERMAIEEAHYSLLKVEYPPAAEAAETTGTPF